MADDDGGTGGDLLHLGRTEVEHRGQGGALAGDGHHLVVLVPVAGADAVGVADGEGRAVADDAGHEVATVPGAGGLLQDARHVQFVGDLRRQLGRVEALGGELAVECLVGDVEEMADLLHHGGGVGGTDRVLAQAHQQVEDLLVIGQVEVAGHRQVAGRPVARPDEGMAGIGGLAAVGAVAQMAEVDLTDVGVFAGQGVDVVRPDLEVLGGLAVLVADVLPQLVEAGGAGFAVAVEVGLAVADPLLEHADASAVLAPVALLLHQQVKLVEAPQGRAVGPGGNGPGVS